MTRSPKAGQAGAEIEITEEMIQAGQNAYWEWERGNEWSTAELVKRIFATMIAITQSGSLYRTD
jgi:hypothetical protein